MKPRFLSFTCCAAVLLTGCASISSRSFRSDADLKSAISRVWFGEELHSTTMHACARYQYFPDGRFLADYRISHLGSEEYVRSIGHWDIIHGIFLESVEETNHPSLKQHALQRRVLSIDDHSLLVEALSGRRAEYIRTDYPLTGSSTSLRGFDREAFLARLLQFEKRKS
jgi:hypothetical protein